MAYGIDLDTYETWLGLSCFFFSRAYFFNNASKNVWLKVLQESIFSFEKTNFSLLKFWELKYLHFLYTISRDLILGNVVFDTVKHLWKPARPQDTVRLCWNSSTLFVKNRPINSGLETFLKHVPSLTILDSSCYTGMNGCLGIKAPTDTFYVRV